MNQHRSCRMDKSRDTESGEKLDVLRRKRSFAELQDVANEISPRRGADLAHLLMPHRTSTVSLTSTELSVEYRGTHDHAFLTETISCRSPNRLGQSLGFASPNMTPITLYSETIPSRVAYVMNTSTQTNQMRCQIETPVKSAAGFICSLPSQLPCGDAAVYEQKKSFIR
jgi:hypothetical protein